MSAPTKPEGAQPSSEPALAKPGWYQDPSSDGQLRWWDGSAWTDYTLPNHQPRRRPQPAVPSSYAKGYRVGALAVLLLALLLAVGEPLTGVQGLEWIMLLAIWGAGGLLAASYDTSRAGRYLALFFGCAVVSLLVKACGEMLFGPPLFGPIP